ncbi:MAG TPA: M12 family metallo-peptidase [Pyrinomonadaceae bacterium]|nr:M12 family metallo-peptidase [Pyrinomonadaceae bacterium]
MDSDEFWTDATVGLRDLSGAGDQAMKYRLVELNTSTLRQALAGAPMEFTEEAKWKSVIVSLPVPDGRLWRFRIEESPIMSPELAAKFREIKTYSGQGIDDPTATLRFSWDPAGLKAFVLSPEGSFTVLPYANKDDRHYLSVFSRDTKAGSFECLLNGEKQDREMIETRYVPAPDFTISGNTLREYRLSFSVTQQFYERFGGPVFTPQNDTAVAAAIAAYVNNLNLIYVTEISSRFKFNTWIADRPGLCGSPGLNCFPPNQSPLESMNLSNEFILDNVFPGASGYDLGVVLGYSDSSPSGLASFGSGGDSSGIGGACEGGYKGRTSILLTGPAGNYWSSVILAHELGHMFGARHTFSSPFGVCHGGDPLGRIEPGSGSTIMSYEPGCMPDNLFTGNISGAADPYFHTHSLIKIANHKNIYSLCGQTTSTGNTPPTILDGGANATIPAYTPFTLTASASDPNGDAITYNWEEWDPGATLYRSYLPSPFSSRTFPDLYFVLNFGSVPPTYLNGFLTGEALPSTTSTLNFTVTVRDNLISGGATTVRDQLLQVNVRGEAGPFFVTQPNTPVTWTGASQRVVSWNVANTNLAPIGTASVRILLSTDGGFTFPAVLAANTPNDGSETVTLPNVQTSSARVKVEAVGNIYFDISNSNFTINQVSASTHRKTVGVFRPSNGIVYLKNANTGGVADLSLVYGVAGDKPIAGDWNGDGIDSLGIYRNGTFYLRNSNTTGAADTVISFGAPGDQPLAGDWNGDGTDTIGVYRPSTGVFFLRNSNSAGPADVSFVLGNPGDVGIAGDWNGDGVTTTGVFRPSNGIIYLKNANSSGFADIYLVYGNAGDLPVAGDWDGDGISSVGIYRNGVFYLRNSNTQGFADLVFAMGNNGDVPIAGDWDGLP